MFPKPRQDLRPNTAEFERLPFVKATGFREYDARWRYPEEINLLGLEAVGLALADLMRARGVPQRIVVGHDYRSYSASIKAALINGLLAGGAEVHDIGLALSPMAYFAQFELGVEGVAMVTASHNDNGWTGIKMGIERPLTFAPDDMTALKERVLEGAPQSKRRRQLHLRARHARALHGRPAQAAEADAGGQGRGVLRQRHGRGVCAARARRARRHRRAAQLRARLHLPGAQSEPGRLGHAQRHARRGAGAQAPISALPSTATATAAAWSTMRARRSSPTRSA